jgi:hypothetical protein
MNRCSYCRKELEDVDTYEYRGVYSCSEHFDLVQENRETQRLEIIREESSKTEAFKELDISSGTTIGKANRKLLRSKLEVASKETARLKEYERPSKQRK